MPLWKQRLFSRLQSPEPGEGGGGDAPEITPEIQAIIEAKIGEAVTGLKAKNGELIATNKEIKSKFDALNQQFEGFDMEAVRGLLTKAQTDEETKLLAAGKIDEVFARRTERYQAETAKQIKAKDDEIARHQAANQKLSGRALSDAILKAATKSGALPEALEDIVLRARSNGWSVNADGEVIALNGEEVILGKDGKSPLSPIEWAESLRETAPHLWPKAEGTGAPGSSATGATGKTIKREKYEQMNPAEQRKAILQDKLTIVD
jgi:hypothetical protein